MEEREGRGVRKEERVLLGFWVKMPKPAFFDVGGKQSVVQSSGKGASVGEDSEVDERHLKDIAEELARSADVV